MKETKKNLTNNCFPVLYRKIIPNQAGFIHQNHLDSAAWLGIFSQWKIGNGHLHGSTVGFPYDQLTSASYPKIDSHLPTTNGSRRIYRFGITFILSLNLRVASFCCWSDRSSTLLLTYSSPPFSQSCHHDMHSIMLNDLVGLNQCRQQDPYP